MKKLIVLLVLFLIASQELQSQNIKSDTIQANRLFEKGKSFTQSSKNDSAIVYYNKTIELTLSLVLNHKT